MNLFSRLAWSDEIPARMATFWRECALLGLLDPGVLEGLE